MQEPGNPSAAARAAAFLERVTGWVAWICGMLSALLILVVLVITIYAVTQRYLLRTPVLWAYETIGMLLVALIMLGAAEAYRRGDHISIDLLTGGATGWKRRLVEAWSDLAVLTLALILFYSSWHAIAFARRFGSYTSGNIEIQSWIPRVPLLFGAGLLALIAVSRLIARLTGAQR